MRLVCNLARPLEIKPLGLSAIEEGKTIDINGSLEGSVSSTVLQKTTTKVTVLHASVDRST